MWIILLRVKNNHKCNKILLSVYFVRKSKNDRNFKYNLILMPIEIRYKLTVWSLRPVIVHEKNKMSTIFILDIAIVYDYHIQRILFVYYPLSNIISLVTNVSLKKKPCQKLVRSAACKMTKIFDKPRENKFVKNTSVCEFLLEKKNSTGYYRITEGQFHLERITPSTVGTTIEHNQGHVYQSKPFVLCIIIVYRVSSFRSVETWHSQLWICYVLLIVPLQRIHRREISTSERHLFAYARCIIIRRHWNADSSPFPYHDYDGSDGVQ